MASLEAIFHFRWLHELPSLSGSGGPSFASTILACGHRDVRLVPPWRRLGRRANVDGTPSWKSAAAKPTKRATARRQVPMGHWAAS